VAIKIQKSSCLL